MLMLFIVRTEKYNSMKLLYLNQFLLIIQIFLHHLPISLILIIIFADHTATLTADKTTI